MCKFLLVVEVQLNGWVRVVALVEDDRVVDVALELSLAEIYRGGRCEFWKVFGVFIC